MRNPNKGRNQAALFQNPGKQQERQIFFPLQGRISGVRHANSVKGKITLVHLYLYDGYPPLYNVPLSHEKINAINGEQWSPEENDEVLVQFINGNINRPVVTGCLPPSDNGIVDGDPSVHPRYYRKMNNTWEHIKKDGSRETYVDKDEILTVKDNQTTTVENGDKATTINNGDEYKTIKVGSKNTTIETGDENTTIKKDKNTTIESGNYILAIDTGKFDWTIASNSIIRVPQLTIDGNLIVTGNITSSGGNISSSTGSLSDSVRSMSSDRDIYNSHGHTAVNTPPTEQQ